MLYQFPNENNNHEQQENEMIEQCTHQKIIIKF